MAAFGIDRSYQWSASVMSSTNQRGKNVVSANSGYTTRSQPASAACRSSASKRSTTSAACVLALDRPQLGRSDPDDPRHSAQSGPSVPALAMAPRDIAGDDRRPNGHDRSHSGRLACLNRGTDRPEVRRHLGRPTPIA